LGTDLLAVSLSDAREDKNSFASEKKLSLNDAVDIGKINNIIEVAPYTQLYQPMIFNGHELNGGVMGVTESFANIVHVDIDKGRFISTFDKYAMYCVVGFNVANKIKSFSGLNALGQQIQVGKNIFTIVGTTKKWPENSFVYANIDNAIMVPILTTMALSKYTSINNIILRLSPDAKIKIVQDNINNYISERLASKQTFFRSAEELVARMAKQSQIFTVFLGLIGSISLIVGGIGVMNIMLVSVVERRREIGIRIAVGAKKTDIKKLFLIEAIMLSLLGGALGVFLGVLISLIMSKIWHWEFTFFLLPPLVGFTVSVAIGVFFGFYPAYKASQMNPIDALKSD